MNAIETLYNGYRFRSRLEARWAVFFDAAGIEYQYEPEGYIGYNDLPYLPDFYLPAFGVFAEVKGSDEQLRQDAPKIEGAIDFNATPVSAGLILLGQIPNGDAFTQIPVFTFLFCWKGVVEGECIFDIWNGKATLVSSCQDEADLYALENGGDFPDGATVKARYMNMGYGEAICTDPHYINRCYELARQARFEFWQTPTAQQVRKKVLSMWR